MDKVSKLYKKLLDGIIKQRQQANNVSLTYRYKWGKHVYELTLPRSVMEQKYLLTLMMKYNGNLTDFETEKEFLLEISKYVKRDKADIEIAYMELDEVELLKENYMNYLLIPLYQWGLNAVMTFQTEQVKQAGLLKESKDS